MAASETKEASVPSPLPPAGEGGAQRRVRNETTDREAGVPSPLRGEGGVRGSVKRARALPSSETDAEHRLWQVVRGRRLGGCKFVRQLPIGPYFADFACREAALIVELDGSQHFGSEHDEVRTRYLNSKGYSVLRIWNNDLLGNPQGVAEAILSALSGHPSPGERFAPATLSPEGRGAKGGRAATARERSFHLTADVPRLAKDP
jgi:very-short-patch-repair endonuclease